MPIYALGDTAPVIHSTAFVHPDAVVIGNVTIGAQASVWLHRVVIEAGALVGAGAVVPNGTLVPSFAMALGVPARIRENAVAIGAFAENVDTYVRNGQRFAAELRRVG